MKLGQNFVKYFVRFLGNGVSRKNVCFLFTDLYYIKIDAFRILKGQTERNRSFPVNIPIAICQFVTIAASRYSYDIWFYAH